MDELHAAGRAPDEMIPIRFVRTPDGRTHRGRSEGEIAQYRRPEVQRLLAAGLAVLHDAAAEATTPAGDCRRSEPDSEGGRRLAASPDISPEIPEAPSEPGIETHAAPVAARRRRG